MIEEYKNIYIMFCICILVSILIFGLSYLFIKKSYNIEKISSYECGFQPFEDSRNRFEVKFYLVAILFIIFDLELAYLYPWILCLHNIGIEGIISMIIFLFILTIGFIYEWGKGALDW